MKVLLIYFSIGRITGVFTSLIDVYLNLVKRGVDVNLKICGWDGIMFGNELLYKENFSGWYNLCCDNKHFGSKKIFRSFTKDKNFVSDVVICSARFPNDMVKNDLSIKAKRWIILDSLDLQTNKFVDYQPDEVLKGDTHFLVNPANFNRTKFMEHEYYHKFSKERLDTLTIKKPIEYIRITKDWMKVDEYYFENIGKSIWETIYCGQDVAYDPIGMLGKDGLYYYLKLFGVDGEKSHSSLPINRKDIEDKLFMRDNDIVLSLI